MCYAARVIFGVQMFALHMLRILSLQVNKLPMINVNLENWELRILHSGHFSHPRVA